jgi:hypothetical protein
MRHVWLLCTFAYVSVSVCLFMLAALRVRKLRI